MWCLYDSKISIESKLVQPSWASTYDSSRKGARMNAKFFSTLRPCFPATFSVTKMRQTSNRQISPACARRWRSYSFDESEKNKLFRLGHLGEAASELMRGFAGRSASEAGAFRASLAKVSFERLASIPVTDHCQASDPVDLIKESAQTSSVPSVCGIHLPETATNKEGQAVYGVATSPARL